MPAWAAALQHQAFMGSEILARKLEIKEAQEISACQLQASWLVYMAEASTSCVVYDPADENRLQ